jgi:Xaa-Pro aminopeptidase
LNEIEDALKNGTCLRGKYTLDLAPGFLRMVIGDPAFSGVLPERIWNALVEELRDAAVNEIAATNIFGIGRDEIKKTIGISDHALRQNISRAIKKIGRESFKRLSSALHEYRELKSRKNIEFVKRTKITITFKS